MTKLEKHVYDSGLSENGGYLKNKICVEKLMIINIHQPHVFWISYIHTIFQINRIVLTVTRTTSAGRPAHDVNGA